MEEQQSRASKDHHKNVSNLYDYQELQAMIGHINKATHFSPNVISSSYSKRRLINSPFYRQRLNQIYKDDIGSTKRITWQQTNEIDTKRRGMNSNASIGWKLWRKIKQGFMGILPKKDVK